MARKNQVSANASSNTAPVASENTPEIIATPEAQAVVADVPSVNIDPQQSSGRTITARSFLQAKGTGTTGMTPDGLLTLLRQRWGAWLRGTTDQEPAVNSKALAGNGSHEDMLAVFAQAGSVWTKDGPDWRAATWAAGNGDKGSRVIGPVWWRIRARLRGIVNDYGVGSVLAVCRSVCETDSQRLTFVAIPDHVRDAILAGILPDGKTDYGALLARLQEAEETLWQDWAYSPPPGFTMPHCPAALNLPSDLIRFLS